MRNQGSNLPGFRAVQLDFAAHIRDPEANPRPGDVEERRMKIYRELFYNNIEHFLAIGFPVAKQVLGEDTWHQLVRAFIATHPSESPYFLEISQEFLDFLGTLDSGSDLAARLPPFLLELCHYEWVELALGVSEVELPEEGVNPEGDLVSEPIVVSPLVWPLAYRWPVHEIDAEHQPLEEPAEPTHVIVYRRRDDSVHFMATNPVTLRLLQLLGEGVTGGSALETLAGELPELDSNVVYEQGLATLTRLREAEILLGTSIVSGH